ncbi:MAG: LuxR C-terminal-related transcriptional regulator [Sandaracinaceae bacterium]|nr:LuxR C-terminal-related transcriptional regulator [Sandaracinaceae bacterium]
MAAGRRYISRRLPAGVLEADSPSSAALAVLTEGERRVLRLVARHMTSREIADLMKLSHRTVQNHRASMVRKLELRGSSALLRFALAHAAELEREP